MTVDLIRFAPLCQDSDQRIPPESPQAGSRWAIGIPQADQAGTGLPGAESGAERRIRSEKGFPYSLAASPGWRNSPRCPLGYSAIQVSFPIDCVITCISLGYSAIQARRAARSSQFLTSTQQDASSRRTAATPLQSLGWSVT